MMRRLHSSIGRVLAGTLALALCVQVCGCRSLRDRFSQTGGSTGKAQAEAAAPPVVERSVAPKAEVLDDSAIIVDKIAPERTDVVEEKFVFPERLPDPGAKVKIADYPDKLIKGIKDPDEKVEVKLNLDATALTEVVPMFALLLNFGYLVDPAVKGAVTMTVDSEMTAREAWEMFEHILWLAGAYASKNPGFIHILPFAKMPKERRIFAKHDPVANVEVALIPILYVKSSEIVGNVKPFMTDGSSITDVPSANSLLIVEAPANMPKLRALIERLDTKGEATWPHICLRCHSVDAEVVLEELEALLPVLGFPVTNKGPSGGQIKLTSIPRLQVIVASAAMKEVLDEVERWCRVLDRADLSEKENIFFYNVKHSTAEQLNEALSVFFNADSTTGSTPSRTKSTSSKASAPGSSSPASPAKSSSSTKATSSRRSSRSSEDEEGETIFDTPVVVYVDKVQNRLTIRTTGRAYALVEALLTRHDVPTRQVLIEAVIADITLNHDTEFGFVYAAKQHSGEASIGLSTLASKVATVAAASSGVVTPVDVGAGNGSMEFALVKGDEMLFLRAVAGDSNVRVLSAPQVMAASGEEAIINVGTRVSIKTNQYGSSEANPNITYQYEDTGTILTVTPYVTAGNEVRLDIKQEVSSVVPDSGTEGSPNISNKVLETVLIIPDGSTLLMGGLIDSSRSDGHRGLPGLKDVPVLGHLFRTHETTSTRHELLVLITVNVISRASGTEALLNRYRACLEEIDEVLGK